MKTILRVILLSGVLLSLLSGCGSIKKSRTKTETITITKIDTVLKIRVDTVYKKTTEPLSHLLSGDTIKTENKVAEARTYFNTNTNKIVLELRGKIFDVPVTISEKKVVKSDIQQKELERPKMPFINRVALAILSGFTGILIYRIIAKPKL
jgi:hypothetical protein